MMDELSPRSVAVAQNEESAPGMKPGYLFVLPWAISEIGGVSEVVKNLYRKVAVNGEFEPAIFVLTWKPDQVAQSAQWIQIPFLLRSPWDIRKRLKTTVSFLAHLPATLRALRRLLTSRNIRIINPHFPELSCLHFALLRTLRLFDGALILSFHLSDVAAATRARGVERLLWRVLLRSADYVVPCSHELANQLLELEPAIKNKLQPVWNGIDAEAFLGRVNENRLGAVVPAQKLGRRFVLNVATFEQKKGQDILINAYEQVLARHDDVDLIMIGRTGPATAVIRGMVSSKGLKDRVIILENVAHNEIRAWMSRAEIFVLPSRSEGFPITLLEAGACAKPVVATRVGGIPELISDGVTGRLIPADDPAALARILIELLGSDLERQRLGTNLRERVTREFTWQRAYERYMSLVKMALTEVRS